MWLFLHKWHRRIGIIAALFVLLLSVTGILLNHTDQFEFDEIYVESGAVLDWYDVRPGTPPVSFAVAGNRLTRIGDRLYFNHTELDQRSDRLYSAVSWNGMIVAALANELLVLSRGGEVVEILTGSEGVPAGLRNIGRTPEGGLVVRGAHGDYLTDINRLTWREREDIEVSWTTATALPEPLRAELLRLYRGKGLTLERVLLDLHSGRILGRYGVYLIDVAALLFVILAISGAWMWYKRQR